MKQFKVTLATNGNTFVVNEGESVLAAALLARASSYRPSRKAMTPRLLVTAASEAP